MTHNPAVSSNLASSKGKEFTLIDAAATIAKHKKRIIFATIVAGIAAAAVSLLIPNIYTGTAQLLPPQQPSGAAALLGQLSSLSGSVGQSLGVKNPNDTYVAMLNSRTVSDNLIRRFELGKVYDKDSPTDTRIKLASATSIFSGKDGIIIVQVDDKQPKRAAALANAYVEELQKLTQILAITEASQRRLFFEKQLQLAKQGLADAEVALKSVQEKTGLIQLNGQAEGMIRAAAELKAQIGAKEVALSSMRTFATADNPAYVRIEQELSVLRAQLRRTETGINGGNGDISIPTSKVPEAGLAYVRKLRDVKYYETIFELLAKQFELAKIDEAKQSSLIQILDSAVEPDKKTKPARSLIVLAAAAVTLLLSIAFVLGMEALRNLEADDENKQRMNRLRMNLRWNSQS